MERGGDWGEGGEKGRKRRRHQEDLSSLAGEIATDPAGLPRLWGSQAQVVATETVGTAGATIPPRQ